jgi:hypothetical protein
VEDADQDCVECEGEDQQHEDAVTNTCFENESSEDDDDDDDDDDESYDESEDSDANVWSDSGDSSVNEKVGNFPSIHDDGACSLALFFSCVFVFSCVLLCGRSLDSVCVCVCVCVCVGCSPINVVSLSLRGVFSWSFAVHMWCFSLLLCCCFSMFS